MRQIVREIQLELFTVEVQLFEFEQKRKELKAKLAKLGAGEKFCTKCALTMGIEQFYRDRQKLDGRTSWCCECVCKYERERRRRRVA